MTSIVATSIGASIVPGVVRAELRRLLRWPAVWLLSGTWMALNLSFAYLFPYLTYRNGDPVGPPAGDGGLERLLPDQAPVSVVEGMPMFGGALVLILGALAVGSGYGWGTWKTVFTTGPRRAAALGGTYAALAVVLTTLVAATFAVDLAASTAIALAEDRAVVAPGLLDAVTGFAAALLIGGMWAAAGTLLGALARGPALAVGLGLVWSLVVENLLRGVAGLLGPLQTVAEVLPGTVVGSVAAAAGALPISDPNGTPGVNTVWAGGPATLLTAVYLLALCLATTTLVARRDHAS
ncbi:MAG: ABC transporter permease [Micromonosporaceae bacterium]|nr:ABC transporter permease [Micromonosporaceae bacterium]